MYSIRPYQAYSFRCWFSNNSILAFVASVLPRDLVSLCSSHSILTFVPEAVYCDFIKYLLILSSSYSILFLFNRSAAQSCSSLFLLVNRVFSTLSISVVFFPRNGLTFSRFLVSLIGQRSNLVLPLLFLFRFPPVPS